MGLENDFNPSLLKSYVRPWLPNYQILLTEASISCFDILNILIYFQADLYFFLNRFFPGIRHKSSQLFKSLKVQGKQLFLDTAK